VEGTHIKLLAVNETKHLTPVQTTTQPPTKTVEIAEMAHPVEKALVFNKAAIKK
jgi:hypothetical protein